LLTSVTNYYRDFMVLCRLQESKEGRRQRCQGKQGWMSREKARLAFNPVKSHGLSLAEAGRQLGV